MENEEIPYQFPTAAHAEDWRAKVQHAINRTLNWTPHGSEPNEWVLSGECPRCMHEMNQIVSLSVVLPGTFGGAEMKAPAKASEVEVEVVCNCKHGHSEEKRGCGFGKGIPVPLEMPRQA
jgi:hypothetical protein